MLKLCIVGNRGHLNYVFDDLPRLPNLVVSGICSGQGEGELAGLRSLCARAGVSPPLYDNWVSMLDSEKPDLAVVCGPFREHASMCVEALRRGIHVFCEKPVAFSVEELDAVRSAWLRSGVLFASMMGLRYDPAFFTARSLVVSGEIGEVRLINAQKSYKLGDRPAYYRERESYGGTIPWVGSHAIDWIRWFSGGRAFRSVHAAHSSRANGGNGSMEASALCLFELEGELFASASIDLLRPGAAPTHGDDRIRVVGTTGVVEVRHGKVFLLGGSSAGAIGTAVGAAAGDRIVGVEGREIPAACHRRIFADFVAGIRGEAECLVDGEDTLAVTEACLLARQAADEGSVIRFPRE